MQPEEIKPTKEVSPIIKSEEKSSAGDIPISNADDDPQKTIPPQNKKPEKEKADLLKREEIKTMQKDVAKLRESEAEKEKGRISNMTLESRSAIKFDSVIKPKEIQKTQPPKKKIEEPVQPTQEKTQPPKKKTDRNVKKIFPRLIAVIVMLIIIGGLVYWLLPSKPNPVETTCNFQNLNLCEDESSCVDSNGYWYDDICNNNESIKPDLPEGIVIPPSLISSPEAKIQEIPDISFLLPAIKTAIKENLEQNTFTRIVIKNILEQKLIEPKDLMTSLQMPFLLPIIEKIDPINYILVIYSQKEGNRMVLIAKVNQSDGLLDELKTAEDTIEKNGISIAGQKIKTVSSKFKTYTIDKNFSFRYLTISKDDLGICYAWFNEYLVISTSFESIKKTINELK